LSGLTNLQGLNPSGCRNLTDAGLEHLKALANLEQFPFEAYLAEGLLASNPSDLKAVVVVGPFGEEGPASVFSPRVSPGTRLVAPVLIYEWPEDILIERAKTVAPHGAPIPRVAAELDRTLRGLR